LNAVLRLAAEQQGAPPALVTASAGNHGRAMAWAVRDLGVALTVYVPADAPNAKLDALRSSGATVVTCGNYDETEVRAKEHARREGALYISPYSHPDVIAGAGTVGLEIIEDWPDVDIVVVPIGGGGLISGVALAVRALSKAAAVAGVEVKASNPFTQSLAAGRIVAIHVQPTLADGLCGNLDPETLTFDIVRATVSRIALVDEAQLRAAVAAIARHEQLITEGAGAVGVAALLGRELDVRGKRVAVVLSGGNIDPDKLAALCEEPASGPAEAT
jgi:threonine dehydratase